MKSALGTIDRARLNVNGGSVGLGHPFAATGANAVLMTYPDSGHGSLFQFHESFTRQATAFLASQSAAAHY
jgi:acetyl-CoA acetyltransferase